MSDLDDRIKSASTTAKADFSAQMGISALEKEGASAARELIDRLKLRAKVYVDLKLQAETLNKHTKAGKEAYAEIQAKMEEISEEAKTVNEALLGWEKTSNNLKNVFGILDNTIGKLGNTLGQGSLDIAKWVTGIGSFYQIAMLAAKTLFDWYEHTAAINRNIYDTNAAMGDLGIAGSKFEDTITSTAWKFKENTDNVANTVNLLAKAGVHQKDMDDAVRGVYTYSKLWSELTPEKQVALMSTFMKEFNMTGKEAGATMIGIFETAQHLKSEYPSLVMDAGKFTEQTAEVALHMRKYGLEAAEAVALTSTLTRLGVEQARIPELAKSIGTIALEQTAVRAAMTQELLLPKMGAEYRRIQAKAAEGEALSEREAGLVIEYQKMQKLPAGMREVGAYGVAEKYAPETLIESQVEWLQKRYKEQMGTTVEGGGRAGIMSFLELAGPTLGMEFSKAAMGQFADVMDKVAPKEFNKELVARFKEARDSAKSTEDMLKAREQQAATVAVATQTMATSVGNIESILGRWSAHAMGVTQTLSIAGEAYAESVSQGKPLSTEELMKQYGLTRQQAATMAALGSYGIEKASMAGWGDVGEFDPTRDVKKEREERIKSEIQQQKEWKEKATQINAEVAAGGVPNYVMREIPDAYEAGARDALNGITNVIVSWATNTKQLMDKVTPGQ